MNTKNKNWKTIKYILGALGILGIVLAILTVTNTLGDALDLVGIETTIDRNNQLIISLTSSIIGILFLFIALSKQIDAFFNVIEKKELKLSKDKEQGGLSIELIFFLSIAVVLIVLAVMLGIGYLAVKTELPLLGNYTEKFLIGSLVVLSLLAIITAFNEILGQSVKEMKKVHWPTSEMMTKFSAQVFTFILFFSLLFFALDLIVDNSITTLDNWINLKG